MSYVREAMPLRRWDREEIIKSEDSIIEFLKFKGPRSFFLLTGVYAGAKVANYLLSLARKEDKVNEEAVQYWMEVIREGKLYYYGGHSTIHIDDDGKLVDWHEKLSAIARCGITDRKLMPSVNIHLGMFAFLHSTIRANETPVAPVQAFKSVLSVADNRPPVAQVPKVVVKEPEYIPKYPSKAIALIMAIQAGDITIKYGRKQTTAWEKENNCALLAACVDTGQGERLSKMSTRFLTATEWDALRYVTASQYPDGSSTFFGLLQSGTKLTPTNAITRLRQQFEMSPNYVSRDNFYRMGVVIRAWNVFREKDTYSDLGYDHNKEEFPKVK